MRIASLLSSATEIVHALGLGDRLVAISHECDFPPEALALPRASRVRFDPGGLTSAEVDAAVRRAMEEDGSVYQVDARVLADARPELILTQAVCEVCAVPTASVRAVAAELPGSPAVLSLDAHTLEEILGTVVQVADAVGESGRGAALAGALRERLERVAAAVPGRPRPRVLALEWLDPPFAPGHWVPEMIELAGGECVLGTRGARSVQVSWDAVAALDPDRLLLVPCGYDLEASRADAGRARERLREVAPRALAAGGAAVGHSAYFSRSGPRVVEGVEALARWLHPDADLAAVPEGRLAPWA